MTYAKVPPHAVELCSKRPNRKSAYKGNDSGPIHYLSKLVKIGLAPWNLLERSSTVQGFSLFFFLFLFQSSPWPPSWLQDPPSWLPRPPAVSEALSAGSKALQAGLKDLPASFEALPAGSEALALSAGSGAFPAGPDAFPAGSEVLPAAS